MKVKVHFSSERVDWETPWGLFAELHKEFGFTLDVCAQEHNTKLGNYFSPDDDGLSQDWSGNTCWMNPPYGREIAKWVEKAHSEAQKGTTVVALLPSRTDTKWFHDFIYKQAEVRFLKGRVRFVGAKNSAPFPSMIVIWRDRNDD